MKKHKGIFITLEGSEGSGKSTQARLLCRYLKSRRIPYLFIREPGGVKISEAIRKVLLNVKNKNMDDICETLLYMAARAQLVKEVIRPALQKGKVVICDRFLDSTVVYQGYGNGVDLKFIAALGSYVTCGLKPGLTLIFDLPVEKGLSRTGKVKDRIELRSLGYHNRVRQGYLALARQEPRRVKIIDADQSREAVRRQVQTLIDRFLNL